MPPSLKLERRFNLKILNFKDLVLYWRNYMFQIGQVYIPHKNLIIKSILVAFFWYQYAVFGGLFWFLGWLLVVGYGFFRPKLKFSPQLISFIVWFLSAFLAANYDFWPFVLRYLSLVLGAIFFVILILHDEVLEDPGISRKFETGKILALFYLILLGFFSINWASFYVWKWFLTAILLGFLWFEWLLCEKTTESFLKPLVASLAIGLFSAEMLVVLSWLPLGSLALANFAWIFEVLSGDLLISYWHKNLDFKGVFRDICLFLALSLVILLTASWGRLGAM